MINYDFKASAADTVKVEIRLSLLSLPFQQWLGVRRTPSHCYTTQHDMLPQHLVFKYELNCEYCNITLARNRAP